MFVLTFCFYMVSTYWCSGGKLYSILLLCSKNYSLSSSWSCLHNMASAFIFFLLSYNDWQSWHVHVSSVFCVGHFHGSQDILVLSIVLVLYLPLILNVLIMGLVVFYPVFSPFVYVFLKFLSPSQCLHLICFGLYITDSFVHCLFYLTYLVWMYVLDYQVSLVFREFILQ